MGFEEAEVLRERALEFLRIAENLIAEGSYDLAAFSIEQYCQLMLKYKLLVSIGTYPRTHSITRLVRELSKIDRSVEQLLSRENIPMITKIEDAYIGARYLPRRYFREEVEAMLRFAKEVFKPIVEGV